MSKAQIIQKGINKIGAQMQRREIKPNDKITIQKAIRKLVDADPDNAALIKQHVECPDFKCCAEKHKCLLTVQENVLEVLGDILDA